ncbi:MAG: hypothetical protein ACKON8_01525 [Planctomycetota bacterium]
MLFTAPVFRPNRTLLLVTGKLRVGSDGNDNTLLVTNGAGVTVASDVFVGGTSSGGTAGGNAITVTGSGSTFTIVSGTADLVIGYGTGTNQVTVADGGTLAVSSIRMGPNGTLAIGQGGRLARSAPRPRSTASPAGSPWRAARRCGPRARCSVA